MLRGAAGSVVVLAIVLAGCKERTEPTRASASASSTVPPSSARPPSSTASVAPLVPDEETGGGRGEGIGIGTFRNPARPYMTDEAVVEGGLTPELVVRLVRARRGPFFLCYEAGLVRSPQLAGRVRLAFALGASGAVARAVDSGSTIGDRDVVECMAKLFRTLSFPASDGAIVTGTYTFGLEPPTAPPAPAATPGRVP